MGRSPVMVAGLHGKKDVFDLLVSKGADLTLRTDNNDTVFHLACQGVNSPIVEYLLPLFGINCRGHMGRSPVMIAGLHGKKDVFELLLSKGADLTLRDDNNVTVLHLARQGGNSPIVEYLLPLFDINCRGRIGLSPVMSAALHGKKDIFDLLLSRGADLTLRADNNVTVLHLACQVGNTPIVE
ncbi:ankyrin repeat and protein kinase domain-containing protein 1-like isoform X2 [Haliotis rubra]|uniref:ankyrin repeat and protein kinase domain-containing protein 1-like isoform X2 n=1 Tax=Haliotis rubra TaxID=36100 RepID=UPI001EE5850A|nr:ankyrin repeat and protein kinase domain-containing protein 1-like isoform X2 [Haliotis rubra]